MSIVNKYIDSNNFLTAISVYNEEDLITLAPDGYYQNNGTYRRQLNGLLGPSVLCESCTPPIACGSIATPGGSGISDISVNLEPNGGLIAFLVEGANSYPDKFEIYHGADGGSGVTVAANKKATSNKNANTNFGPFDNIYGTSPSNTIPTEAQADTLPQFIASDVSPVTRQTEFNTATGYSIPSMTVDGKVYQQIVWWEYLSSDYNVSTNAVFRITAPSDVSTVWTVLRLCCPDNNCT